MPAVTVGGAFIMIKAVFFDFYNTLVYFWPRVEDIQISACEKFDIEVSREGIGNGYLLADTFFNIENSRFALSRRSACELSDFFAKYEQIILRGAGVEVDIEKARSLWEIIIMNPKEFKLFDDVLVCLKELKSKNYIIGIISNINLEMDAIIKKLGLKSYVNFCVTSQDVGAEKPSPTIFSAALRLGDLMPAQAVYIGDQYRSDVVGARNMNMLPVLIDRQEQHSEIVDCIKIRSLSEVPGLVSNWSQY